MENVGSLQVSVLTINCCEFWNKPHLKFIIVVIMAWNALPNESPHVWSQCIVVASAYNCVELKDKCIKLLLKKKI